ncbi:Uncharacterised protein [Salmonella enterica subsp. enterica serovar Bovismorbificans]|uniref:Uncharacterized protein n=1 Tax=Salmonella enterica subsp. enterica serovar Bovismorbificans TaxID=58097 RepID=A0A655CAQ3_SALET|nr:Uncharacterised protein [Salmonella enterica subsp. enterica serovar Bovismorbificans]CQQ76210.1 Uncharacterised protein [Salmonella enterica subsp. enterica serovar Typhimurium str. DT104]CQT67424.1 Uncharacterised protein [Salmonella enterica subsp. enterica serovar Typhi]VFS83915.1 Uncharacterised protein [Salmonella enterica subsp. enterica]CNV04882.1 Uncharacterised protein [Salmonella enterica subsp. enterica serovar Bovismorbificans]
MIFRIFEEEEGVDMQSVFVFKEARGCFDIFQFRTRRQTLAQLRLYAQSLVVVRFDQIDPYGINQAL